MRSIYDTLVQFLGTPPDMSGYNPDYGQFVAYLCACILLCIVVSSVFKFLIKLIER